MSRKQYRYDISNRQVGIVSAEVDGTQERIRQSNRYDGEGLHMKCKRMAGLHMA